MVAKTVTPPTVRMRRLAAELRRMRSAAKLSREDVTAQTGINEATLYRIETARTRPQKRTLIALLNLYEAADSKSREILQLLADARTPGWLKPYRPELLEVYNAFISFESEACGLQTYESLLIPGLLQTEEYVRAAIKGILPLATKAAIEDRVQARLDRQAAWFQNEPRALWAVVDEAAIRRLVGGPEVMRAQLDHLLQTVDRDLLTLQVIPLDSGAHAGMVGSFVILEFPEPEDPPLVYLETMAGDLFAEDDADVRRYRVLFDNLRAVALSPKKTAELIRTARG